MPGAVTREKLDILRRADSITLRSSFDPEKLLASIGETRSSRVLNLAKDQTVFAQGDAADSVFHIQKGRVKLSVVSKQGKEG